MDSEDRQTALGFYHYAHSFAASGSVLAANQAKSTHAGTPVRFLYRHAVELYLKAFLRLQGVSSAELATRKFGHSTVRLMAGAMKHGVQLNERNRLPIAAFDDAISADTSRQAHAVSSRTSRCWRFARYGTPRSDSLFT